jgi:uncharacterized integral membrane protein
MSSDLPPSQAQSASAERHGARLSRERLRSGALVILAVLITLFAVFNLDEVKVHWIFGSGKAPLIIVIVVSVLVGIVLSHFAERRFSKRKKH